MIILIDGDSCNVVKITEKIAQKYNIECHLFHDTTRNVKTEYAIPHIVDTCSNSADMAILHKCENNKAIVITNDSGLATMVKAMNNRAVNPRGFEYTDHDICKHLDNRYMRKTEMRTTGRKQVHGIPPIGTKRTNFEKLIDSIISEEKEKQ